MANGTMKERETAKNEEEKGGIRDTNKHILVISH